MANSFVTYDSETQREWASLVEAKSEGKYLAQAKHSECAQSSDHI
jgi:hypothetical protein